VADGEPNNGRGHNNPLGELMTAEQLAALLLVRKSTVEDYARRGLLPSLKLGRHRRFVRSDVIHAIEKLRDQRAPS
jgi:excisionase family DNA binding protein